MLPEVRAKWRNWRATGVTPVGLLPLRLLPATRKMWMLWLWPRQPQVVPALGHCERMPQATALAPAGTASRYAVAPPTLQAIALPARAATWLARQHGLHAETQHRQCLRVRPGARHAQTRALANALR